MQLYEIFSNKVIKKDLICNIFNFEIINHIKYSNKIFEQYKYASKYYNYNRLFIVALKK